jgi:nucleoside-diphosphate kinase
MERTLVVLKPDAVQRALVGPLIGRFEQRGLRIVGMKLVRVDKALAERHYAVHEGKPFYGPLVAYITSGPVVAMALEGPDAVAVVRSTVGSTRPPEATPGSIRSDFALQVDRNLVHASDGPDTASAELALWFDPAELIDYRRDIDRWIVAM